MIPAVVDISTINDYSFEAADLFSGNAQTRIVEKLPQELLDMRNNTVISKDGAVVTISVSNEETKVESVLKDVVELESKEMTPRQLGAVLGDSWKALMQDEDMMQLSLNSMKETNAVLHLMKESLEKGNAELEIDGEKHEISAINTLSLMGLSEEGFVSSPDTAAVRDIFRGNQAELNFDKNNGRYSKFEEKIQQYREILGNTNFVGRSGDMLSAVQASHVANRDIDEFKKGFQSSIRSSPEAYKNFVTILEKGDETAKLMQDTVRLGVEMKINALDKLNKNVREITVEMRNFNHKLNKAFEKEGLHDEYRSTEYLTNGVALNNEMMEIVASIQEMETPLKTACMSLSKDISVAERHGLDKEAKELKRVGEKVITSCEKASRLAGDFGPVVDEHLANPTIPLSDLSSDKVQNENTVKNNGLIKGLTQNDKNEIRRVIVQEAHKHFPPFNAKEVLRQGGRLPHKNLKSVAPKLQQDNGLEK